MKLQSRLRKVMAVTALVGTLATSTAVFASDYKGHWAEATITEWKDKGVITGYEDGSFKPKEQVTRAELAKMLTEVFGLTLTQGAPDYKDVAAGTWHETAIDAVSVAGLMTGTKDGNFRPSEPATREEAAYAIATAYRVTGESKAKFKDHPAISEWAVEAVEALAANGYIDGYKEDGTFRPQGAITRVEALVMLDKITAELINEPGTYKGEQKTVGNVIVNKQNVILKDMVIDGNLYLAQGIGEGDVTLDNVTVTGNIIVEGGGANSIHVKGNSKLNNINVAKLGSKPVRIALSGTEQITGKVMLETATIIEGTSATVPAIVVNGAPTFEIKGQVEIAKVDVEQPTTLTVDKESTLKEVTIQQAAAQTKVDGTGTIQKMVVEANEVIISNKVAINKDNITVGGDVITPPVVEKPAGGGGGGGGGGPVTPSKKKLEATDVQIISDKNEVELQTTTIDKETNTITVDIAGFAGNVAAIQVLTNAPATINKFETITDSHGETLKFMSLKSGEKYTVEQVLNNLIDPKTNQPLYKPADMHQLNWLTYENGVYGISVPYLVKLHNTSNATDVLSELFGVIKTAKGFEITLPVIADSTDYENTEVKVIINVKR